MRQNILETIIGFIVIVVALVFFVFAYNSAYKTKDNMYNLFARFESVEGVSKGSDIMLAGIKIGKVKSLTLDPDYFALMEMDIENSIQLSTDSQVAVVSSGFLGSKYVSVTPGGDTANLKHGDRIKFTQSSINIETLVGKFIYSFGNNNK